MLLDYLQCPLKDYISRPWFRSPGGGCGGLSESGDNLLDEVLNLLPKYPATIGHHHPRVLGNRHIGRAQGFGGGIGQLPETTGDYGDATQAGLLGDDACPQSCGRAAPSGADPGDRQVALMFPEPDWKVGNDLMFVPAMHVAEFVMVDKLHVRVARLQFLSDDGEHFVSLEEAVPQCADRFAV
jgi:hypothetical protein